MPPESYWTPLRASSTAMIGVRACKSRRRPFVCASCQQKLSTIAVSTVARLSPHRPSTVWSGLSGSSHQSPAAVRSRAGGARHLSASAPLRDSHPSGGPSEHSQFPNAFGGGAGAAWGSFAGTAAGSKAGSEASVLLPHEREARKRMVAHAPLTRPAPAMTEPKPPVQAPRKQMASREGFGRGPSREQVNRSRSVLANVFNASHQPRSPPTPASWTTAAQQSESKAASAMAPPPPPPSPAHRRSGLGLYGNRKVTGAESSKPVADPVSARQEQFGELSNRKATLPEPPKPSGSWASAQQQTWGGFSNRKVTMAVSPKPMANPAAAQQQQWGEFSNRLAKTTDKTVQPAVRESATRVSESIAAMEDLVKASKRKVDKTKANDQNFWEQLEDKFASFKESSKVSRETAAQQFQDESPMSDDAVTRGTNEYSRTSMTEAQQQRRQRRFGMDDEPGFQERTAKKFKKVSKRGLAEQDDRDWDDEAIYRWEQRQRAKAKKEARKQEASTAAAIFLPEYIVVSDLAQALKQRTGQFLKDLEEMGFENITLDTIMTGDTASLVAMEYGFEPIVDAGSKRDIKPRPPPADVSSLPARPPVVTIMGHVDHGKTTLLDWLRKSSVAAQEHGGITQHIGAFMVKMSSGKPITFLDTPGHAAFLTMRKRGADVTDIVVLVVAADDSVMPQTIEALKHARAAKVPIIVAINKVDKEDARIEQVKADLSRNGVEIEDYGGDVQVVCVSGKTGQGMDDLEENIVALSEVLDVRAESDGLAEGWVLESSIKQDGKAATILVKRGTLRVGDFIVAGNSWARIRVLRNEAGGEVAEALPGTPVEVLGWRELPPAGQQVLQAPDEGAAKSAVEYRVEMAEREESSLQLAEQEQRQREKAAAEAAQAAEAENGGEAAASVQDKVVRQNFSVKADVVGSVEAVCASILELGNHEVRATILRSSAGQISEYDVDHAAASNSILVNFNSPLLPHIKQRADAAKVKIIDHSVIYHVVDAAKAVLSELLPDNVSTRVVAEADILQIFSINLKKRVNRNIAGCRVRNGTIKKTSRIKVLRKGRVVYDGHIDTLKSNKNDVSEMAKGSECGIGLDGFEDFEVDDQIQTYEEVREKRSL